MAEDTRAAGGDTATEIAAGYPRGGQALELGSVVIDGTVHPVLGREISRSLFGTAKRRR